MFQWKRSETGPGALAPPLGSLGQRSCRPRAKLPNRPEGHKECRPDLEEQAQAIAAGGRDCRLCGGAVADGPLHKSGDKFHSKRRPRGCSPFDVSTNLEYDEQARLHGRILIASTTILAPCPMRLGNGQISVHSVARVPGLGTLLAVRIQEQGSQRKVWWVQKQGVAEQVFRALVTWRALFPP